LRDAAKHLMAAGEDIKNAGSARRRTANAMREVRIDHLDMRAAIARLERQLRAARRDP